MISMPHNYSFKGSVEYKKLKTILVLDPKIFQPCQVKGFVEGILRRTHYFIHFDGKKWDILRVSSGSIKRFILEEKGT
jgi:hypothetical protein